MKKKRTKELDEQIARMYHGRIKTTEIARQLQLSRTTVYESLREQDIPRTQGIIPESLYSEIVELYQGGTGYVKISNQISYPSRQVRQVLVDHGIEIQLPTQTRYNIDEHAFDVIDNELAAYWLGFIYADGCVYKNSLSIELHIKDKDHLEKIKPFLKTKRPLYITPKARFSVRNDHLSQRLKELGILVDRPNIVLAVSQFPIVLARHFIRGYFDGDGSARKKKTTIRFCVQMDIAEWLKEHFRTFLNAECRRRIQGLKNTNKIFLLEFSPVDSLLIRDYLYKDASVWLERKKEIMDRW